MKILIVEDDFGSRKLLHVFLSPYGDCDIVVDGEEAIEAFRLALQEGTPYDLICLDIMLPKLDGQEVLKRIRTIEEEHNIVGKRSVKIIMTTALGDAKSIMTAFNSQCEGYLQKPIEKERLIKELRNLELI